MATPDAPKLSRIALRTALLYTLLAGVWIFASDRVVAWLVTDHEVVARLSIAKGWLFVVVTGTLLYYALRRQLRRIEIQAEDRQRSALELAEQRERLDSIIEGTDVGTWEWNVRSSAVVVNEQWAAMLGYTVDELKPVTIATCQALWHGDELSEVQRLVEEHFAGATSRYDFEGRMRHKDGHWVWVHARGRLMTRTPDGKPLMMFGTNTDITARKHAELALRASEERFRAVVESCPAAIFIQREGRFAYVNPATIAVFGAGRAEDMIGRDVLEWIHPSSREAVAERIRQLNESGIAQQGRQHQILRPDGRDAFVEVMGVPFGSDERPTALVFARDVTDERRATEQLRFHESVLRETGEIAKVGGWSFDPATGAGFWTEEVARIHGLDPSAATSRETGLSFYTEESRARIEAALRAAVEAGTPYDLELELTTAAGERKWVRTIGHPVVEHGRVVRVRGAFQDITELHQSNRALRESEERFRQLAENINEVFWISEGTAVEGRIVYVSPAYAEVWGRSPEGLIRGEHRWSDTLHPDDRPRLLETAAAKMIAGTYRETYRILRPDGELRWVLDRAFPLRDEAGRVFRIVGTAEDITEQRLLEEQLRQAQKMQAIGTLAGGIAHDFNNLLGAIMGFAEITRLQLQDRPQERENVDDILRAGRRAMGLVRQILAFSRRSASERVHMQLPPVVHEAVRLLRATVPTTIAIDSCARCAVPPVIADPTQVHQVIMNLGTNAWHAMRSGAGRLEVVIDRCEIDADAVRVEPRLHVGSYVRVSVSDTGAGISPEVLERIYEPFFTTKAPGEGTGLGLAVVHGIMREHDGFITVDSRVGAGTTFRLHFPAVKLEAPEIQGDGAAVPLGRGERLLFVDDEPALVRLGIHMLRQLGYSADGAESVAEALTRVRGRPGEYALVLTDQTMPTMTGVALARELHRIQPRLKVILVTGHAGELTAESLAREDIADLLLKPLTLATLAESIHKALLARSLPA